MNLFWLILNMGFSTHLLKKAIIFDNIVISLLVVAFCHHHHLVCFLFLSKWPDTGLRETPIYVIYRAPRVKSIFPSMKIVSMWKIYCIVIWVQR